MPNFKDTLKKIKKSHLQVVGVLLLVILAACLIIFNNVTSMQANSALMAQVYFDGQYRIGDGDWQDIVEGGHISATQGDVTLRGNFHMKTPDGEYVGVYRDEIPIAFFVDHINLTFHEVGFEPGSSDMENEIFGSSSCGESWIAYTFMSDSEELIDIVVHNPHSYGNENAVDDMLASIQLWANIDFEKEAMKSGESQRNMGITLLIVSMVFLGTALFSTLIHVKNSRMMWLIGLVIFFASIYFTYSADGVSFWSYSVPFNTTVLGISMMFYMLFVIMSVVFILKTTKKIGYVAVFVLALSNAIFFVLPVVSDVLFYDTWLWWIIVQLLVNAAIAYCVLKEFVLLKTKLRWIYIGSLLPLVAFAADIVGTWLGAWKGGVISKYVFIVLFVLAVIMVLKLIPNNINAAAKAKELEMEKIVLNAELTQSRISTMMSQIRPHFIYNTLGSIEQLCDLDPKKAGELVHDFAKYLRGNFGELDNPKPIPMSQEMDHVRHYVSIENVRFPDMTFTFEMNSSDFYIPALTVQPIVENAIKHGLMKLQKGGSIHVFSYETEDEYRVSVVDDGVGFDTTLLLDERKHVGLRNIRERLKAMVNGTIEIDSAVGAGTKVLVRIPKEGKK